MKWNEMGITEKAGVIKMFVESGVEDVESMRKLWDSNVMAGGGSTSPDYDPENPYHYHNKETGKKVAISPDAWEYYKDKPYFENIRRAVEEERAAYPEQEYIENPEYKAMQRDVYQGVNAVYPNWRMDALPQGFTTRQGIVYDGNGVPYIPQAYAFDAQGKARFGSYGQPISLPYSETNGVYDRMYYPVQNVPSMMMPKPTEPVVVNVGEQDIAEKAMDELTNYLNDNTKREARYGYVYPFTEKDGKVIVDFGDGNGIQTVDSLQSAIGDGILFKGFKDPNKALQYSKKLSENFERLVPVREYRHPITMKDIMQNVYYVNNRPDPEEAEQNVRLNLFANGGSIDRPPVVNPYESFKSTLPNNLRNSGSEYNMRRYWELNGYPKDFEEGKDREMFTKEDDGYYHARSVARNGVTGNYEFMKGREHPTHHMELDWYYSNDPEAVSFREQYKYVPGVGSVPDQYVKRKFAPGGDLGKPPLFPLVANAMKTPEQKKAEAEKQIRQNIEENLIYHSKNETLPEVRVTAQHNPALPFDDYYKAHAGENMQMKQRVADRIDQGWVPEFMMSIGTLPFDVEGATSIVKSLRHAKPFDYGAFKSGRLDKTKVDYEFVEKPWKNEPSKSNNSMRIYLKDHDKGYFELVKDNEPDMYSVHFKTSKEGAKYNSPTAKYTTKDERRTLFEELVKAIPEGGKVSTWGSLSDDGIRGLNNIGRDMVKVGERQVTRKSNGNSVMIPIFQKTN